MEDLERLRQENSGNDIEVGEEPQSVPLWMSECSHAHDRNGRVKKDRNIGRSERENSKSDSLDDAYSKDETFSDDSRCSKREKLDHDEKLYSSDEIFYGEKQDLVDERCNEDKQCSKDD